MKKLIKRRITMEVRPGANPADVKNYDTDRLRHDFLVQNLFVADEIKTVYSQIDRIIVGAATPAAKTLTLEAGAELRAAYFLERREMGIINIGGNGTVTVDGKDYKFKYKDGMYIGMGAKEIKFASDDAANPAKFYFNSALHIRHILQYLSTQPRIFFLKIRKNSDVLRVLTTELSTSIFFRDRLSHVSLRWV